MVALVKHLGRDKAHFVSHDWGGAIGWWLNLKYPDMVERAVILNLPHPVVFTKTLKSSFKQLKSSWYVIFFQLPWLPEWYLQKQDFRALRGVFKTLDFVEATSQHVPYLLRKAEYIDQYLQQG